MPLHVSFNSVSQCEQDATRPSALQGVALVPAHEAYASELQTLSAQLRRPPRTMAALRS